MTKQFTREFDPPHVPYLLDTYGNEENIIQKYRYRGFEFEMYQQSARFLFFGYKKWSCREFGWPGSVVTNEYSYGGWAPGSIRGSFDEVSKRVLTDIDRNIEEDLAEQAKGRDSQYESVQAWFERNG